MGLSAGCHRLSTIGRASPSRGSAQQPRVVAEGRGRQQGKSTTKPRVAQNLQPNFEQQEAKLVVDDTGPGPPRATMQVIPVAERDHMAMADFHHSLAA